MFKGYNLIEKLKNRAPATHTPTRRVNESVKDEIGKFWMVTTPSGQSGMGDICFELDLKGFMNQVRGGLKYEEVLAFLKSESSAKKMAQDLLDGQSESAIVPIKESLTADAFDAMTNTIDAFMALAKKAVPNIKSTSKALAALKSIEKASDDFFQVAQAEVEEGAEDFAAWCKNATEDELNAAIDKHANAGDDDLVKIAQDELEARAQAPAVEDYEVDGVEFDVEKDDDEYVFHSDMGTNGKKYKTAADAAHAAKDYIRAELKKSEAPTIA